MKNQTKGSRVYKGRRGCVITGLDEKRTEERK